MADLSIAAVAVRAGVAERTVYRHFGSREGLTSALAAWVNATLGDLPDDLRAADLGPGMAAMFDAFNEHEAMVRGVLASPGGQEVRDHARAIRLRRIDAALRPVLPADPERAAALRALVFLLCSATTWRVLRDDGGLTGAHVGRAVQWGIESLLSATEKA